MLLTESLDKPEQLESITPLDILRELEMNQLLSEISSSDVYFFGDHHDGFYSNGSLVRDERWKKHFVNYKNALEWEPKWRAALFLNERFENKLLLIYIATIDKEWRSKLFAGFSFDQFMQFINGSSKSLKDNKYLPILNSLVEITLNFIINGNSNLDIEQKSKILSPLICLILENPTDGDNIQLAYKLLKLIDNVNVINANGSSILQAFLAYTSRFVRFDKDMLKLLITKGADLTLKDNNGEDSIVYSAFNLNNTQKFKVILDFAKLSTEQLENLLIECLDDGISCPEACVIIDKLFENNWNNIGLFRDGESVWDSLSENYSKLFRHVLLKDKSLKSNILKIKNLATWFAYSLPILEEWIPIDDNEKSLNVEGIRRVYDFLATQESLCKEISEKQNITRYDTQCDIYDVANGALNIAKKHKNVYFLILLLKRVQNLAYKKSAIDQVQKTVLSLIENDVDVEPIVTYLESVVGYRVYVPRFFESQMGYETVLLHAIEDALAAEYPEPVNNVSVTYDEIESDEINSAESELKDPLLEKEKAPSNKPRLG